jgi:polyphosphate:AMP phosphotransferase
MFEAVELGRKISKQEYKQQEPELRTQLLEIQRRLRTENVSTTIIVSGVEGAGKGEVVNRLNEWLDTRGIETHAFWDETEEEQQRPRYWRFWRCLPARGTIGIMFGSWYTQPIIDRVFNKTSDAELEKELRRVTELEQMLVDDGSLVIKLWFHLSKDTQAKRIKKKKSLNHSPFEKKFSEHYESFAAVSEFVIRETNTGTCPWHLIESEDKRYRDIATGRTVLEAMGKRLNHIQSMQHIGEKLEPLTFTAKNAMVTILDHVNLQHELKHNEYKKQLAMYQLKLNQLAWAAWKKKVYSVAVFEGWDAAGKGSAIRRVNTALDARLYRVISIAAPTDEERAHHYLWRFWRHIPRAGYMTIYDRSWYGRVLVERVEGFASESQWMRAYKEIGDFEEQLCEHGMVLSKFWIHISQDEQLKRFKERENTPWKQYKITDEDWRNREKWDQYKAAVNDMVARTSTSYAPWFLIPGNDKKYARVEILKTLCTRLEAALG